jgi:hypothetical protein
MTEQSILRVFEVRRPDCGNMFCIYRKWQEVEAEFDGAEPGETINVRLKNMTKEELDALPDFEGW